MPKAGGTGSRSSVRVAEKARAPRSLRTAAAPAPLLRELLHAGPGTYHPPLERVRAA